MITASAALIVLQLTIPVQNPPWPLRPDPREWGPEEQQRRMPPWPPHRSWGPQGPPCILYGDCRGPKYEERYQAPPYRYPRPDRYEPDRYQPDYDGWDDL